MAWFDHITALRPLAEGARSLFRASKEHTSETRQVWGWPNATLIDYAMMTAVAGVAFVSYWHTLCPGVYPGGSAVATANALGVLPAFSVSNPVWLAIVRGVAALQLPDPVYALNLVNAAFASLALAWLFLIVRRLSFLLVRPTPSWRMVPSDEEGDEGYSRDDYCNRLILDHESETMEVVASTLGGLVAVLTFAFCAPFWQASTSLHPEPFDLFLAFLATDLLARYAFRAHLGAGVVAVFLFGLLTIEWPVFLLLAPFIVGTVVLSAIRHQQLTESFLLLMLVSGFVGAAFGLFEVFIFSVQKQSLTAAEFVTVVSGMLRTQLSATFGGIPRHDGFFVVVLPLLALGFAIKGCSVSKRLMDVTTRWKWRAINLLFTMFVFVNLLNLPKSVWAVVRESACLPILPSLAIAVCTGYLFVFWFLTSKSAHLETDPEHAAHGMDAGRQIIGYGLCGLLSILVLRLPVTNLRDGDGRKAVFADRCAKEVLALAVQSRCLVTDGLLDLNILIAQKMSGSHLTVIPLLPSQPATASAPNSCKAPRASAGGEGKSSPDLKTFLIDWMRANPAAQNQLSFFCPVTFLQKAGIPTPPNGMCYTGLSALPSKEVVSEVFKSNHAAWQRLLPLLCEDDATCPSLGRKKAALREFVSRVANDMGVYLQQAGLLAEADAAYAYARQFKALNLTATLNQYGLRLCHKELGSYKEIADGLLNLAGTERFFETFDEKIGQGGLLVVQEADSVLPEVIADSPVGTVPPTLLMALMSRWLPQSRHSSATAGPILCAAPAGASPLDKAFVARANGHDNHSETLLRRLISEHPEDLSAWALLAERMLEKGAPTEVESRIIPAMRTVSGSENSALVEMTQGALHLHAKPPRYAMARVSFRRALQLRPDLTIAGEQLLGTSLALGDAGLVEEDATTVIQCMPSNTLAHALLGSLRLRQKRYAEAESHLRISLASHPSAGAYNDLAELFRQQKKWEDAEPPARTALRLDPGFYQAWDTLGCILADSGRLKDAEAAFRCVTKLCPAAAEGYLGLAEVWRKQGRDEETTQLLQFVTTKLPNLSPSARAKAESLRAKL